MNQMIKAVFFDWAGTMVDFGSRAPVIAMQAVFEAAGVPVTEGEVRAHMGKAKREHVMAMFEDPEVQSRWKAAKGNLPGSLDADHLMIGLEPAMSEAAAKASTLIPGALEVFQALTASGVKIGSSTGYTPTMMAEVASRARAQGYEPATILCAGDTSEGRPAPLMLWQAMINLGVWPARACVAVDDAPVGIQAGREAGMWTVGLAGSGNEFGLDEASYLELLHSERRMKLGKAAEAFVAARADVVIATVADLPSALTTIAEAIAQGLVPGSNIVLDASITN